MANQVDAVVNLLWFSYDDLAQDLPDCVACFVAKFGHEPKVIWTINGEPVPEKFGLTTKKDERLGKRELFLA